MKKVITYICLLAAVLLILDTINAANSLLLLLFAGVVPGTNLIIAPVEMMAAFATAFTVVIIRITLWPTLRQILFANERTTTTTRKSSARRVA